VTPPSVVFTVVSETLAVVSVGVVADAAVVAAVDSAEVSVPDVPVSGAVADALSGGALVDSSETDSDSDELAGSDVDAADSVDPVVCVGAVSGAPADGSGITGSDPQEMSARTESMIKNANIFLVIFNENTALYFLLYELYHPGGSNSIT